MRRVIVVWDCVPPHPDPQGEGIPCTALGAIETLRIRKPRERFSLSPGVSGPGWALLGH
jgi:hypothetical protein